MIHLLDLNWQSRKVEIGILMDKEYKGKGHAFDALVVIVDYIFNKLNLNKVYVKVLEKNERLIRFCKKGGFEVEGVLKEEVFQDGVFHNQVYLAMFQKDFREIYKDYFKDPGMSLRKVLRTMKG
jgi:RimJ/RimL family protein N-acetyltransferase